MNEFVQNEKNYHWLSEDSVAESVKLFSNYLSLGEYEQARAVLLLLHKKHAAVVETILRTLLTQGPQRHWLASASVPTASHLAWCLWCDYRTCFPEVRVRVLSDVLVVGAFCCI
jgi:hypothetical protein